MTLNRRETKMGFGDWSPGGVWGGNPIVTPTEPQARSAINYESGSEASPDSTNTCLSRREAEKGCREQRSLLGFGAKPQAGHGGGNPIVTPSAKRNPSMNQGAKQYLIPLTPHPPATA